MKINPALFLAAVCMFLLQSCHAKPTPEMIRLEGTYDDTTSSRGENWFSLKADGTYYLSQHGGGKSGHYTVSGDTVVLKNAGDALGSRGIPKVFIIEGDNLDEAGSDRMRIRRWERRR